MSISLETCEVHYKTSKNNKGYLLFERHTNDKTYRVCLFENHWKSLQPLIGCISYDLLEGTRAEYRWHAYKPQSYVQDREQYVKVQQRLDRWNVILGLVNRKNDRGYTWWLTVEDWFRLINETFDIGRHLEQ